MTPRRSTSRSPSRTAETWRSAFLRQASSDYEIFRWMNENARPLCHQLHYLQMASEKLAKAFLCDRGNRRPPQVHNVLVTFLRVAKLRGEFRRACKMSKPQFRSFIDGLLPLADAVEKLAPAAGPDNPNPEYPWEAAGSVVSPLDYAYPSLNLKTPKMQKFRNFIWTCLNIA